MYDRNCYERAFERLLVFGKETDVLLCHGYPRLTRDDEGVPAGTRYGHAWLECNGLVTDSLTGHLVPLRLYYHVGRIEAKDVRRYTYEEAIKQIIEHNTFGDWIDDPPEGTTYHDD